MVIGPIRQSVSISCVSNTGNMDVLKGENWSYFVTMSSYKTWQDTEALARLPFQQSN